MPRIQSFRPVSSADAKVLILGSMPGKESLKKGQYYAHPQNAFWKIMGELIGAQPEFSYEKRLDALKFSGIALWDELASCVRRSSLDSHIQQEIPNDFVSFFKQHPHITHVLFNGAKAKQGFMKFVQATQVLPPLEFCRLPSTSPAHAGMRYEKKLECWRESLHHAGARLSPR